MNHHQVATDLMHHLELGAGPQEGVIRTYQSKTIPIGKRETTFVLDVYDLGSGAMALVVTVESGAAVAARVVHRHIYFAGASTGSGNKVADDLELMNSHRPIIPNAVVDVSDLVIDGQDKPDIAVVTKLSYVLRQISMSRMVDYLIIPDGLPQLDSTAIASAILRADDDDFYNMCVFPNLWDALCFDMIENLTLHLMVRGTGLQ